VDLSKLQIQVVKCTVDARDHARLAILRNTQVKWTRVPTSHGVRV
jgi:hypothetical protein